MRVVLRSPHAHARFKHRRRREGARRCRACGWCSPATTSPSSADCRARPACRASKIDVPPYPVLARDEVRHVGDAVAFVVADTLEQARDAAEAIEIEWEPLPHVIGAVSRAGAGAPQVWPDRPAISPSRSTLGDQATTADGVREGARARCR